jgi:PAS domain S-box-containing protein
LNWPGTDEDSGFQVLWEDSDRIFCRGRRRGADGSQDIVLAVMPAEQRPTPSSVERLIHEFALRDQLDGAWAVQPLELRREGDRTMLLLEDPGAEPLERLVGAPLETRRFLRLAIGIVAALGEAHRRGLVHKDIKPANILVNLTTGEVRLTGFGIASRLPRERQAPDPPETIAGTLAYMAPEQTGRMNRSIDSRSDLYALGVTFYQMLTGTLPFAASDPMEWVHCQIARKPTPPRERSKDDVAPAVSALVMRLLAKTAEERYQTAGGVERDLRRCLEQWDAQGHIDSFLLGQQDTPDRLLIPEKLYGREREVETLLAAFDRIVASGPPELVLVSGYSGIGKSSVVNELHKVLVLPRGLFAAGKFDQYKRDIPYATLAQAFASLVRPLLGKSDTELGTWREALLDALGPNGRLMTDIVPELELIIGGQPAVPELAPQDAQRRFQLVFRRFIGVFARPQHPLALFLDDLQWLDAATLDLVEDLLIRSDLQHLMLVGAYRDNEVDATHPLARKLEAIRSAGGRMAEIRLAPLARDDLGQLMAEALRCEAERGAPLAQLVHDKTGGNPFFAIQFISSLAEEGMLDFDHDALRWSWDLERIHAKGYTDNVVDLMVAKLSRLPTATQQALQLLACLGSVAEIGMLSIILGISDQQVHADLQEAIRLELVERSGTSCRFVHDRVQEAAYLLIPEASRRETHLRIGRLLATQTPAENRDAAIFDIVNQLNRGVALITRQEEREQLAELNLLAGNRAKASTAYASALNYLVAGAALLPPDWWQRRRELVFELELHRAECEFLTGAMTAAEERLRTLSTRAATTVERAAVGCLRADLYTTLGQSRNALAVGLEYLGHLGVDWSLHPTDDDVRREYDRFWSRLGGRAIEDLIELPVMTDPASLATMDVLTKVGPAAFTLMEANFHALAICWAANLSLDRGNSDGSCDIYVRLGFVAGNRFGDYKAGFRFGRLGCELVERRGLKRFQARTYLLFAHHVIPYAQHVRTARDMLHRGFEVANSIGDLMFVGWYNGLYLTENLLAVGDPLAEVQREAERGLAFAGKAQVAHVTNIIQAHLGLVRMLRGQTRKFASAEDEKLTEARFANNPDAAFAEYVYCIRKLQAHFHTGDHALALEAAARAQRHTPSGLLNQVADLRLYSALSHAALCDAAGEGRQHHLEVLAADHQQLATWADNCPDNFENRAALVGAEIARIEGRDMEAMRLYQRAIRSARANGFADKEALANELAARFYAARGFDEIAHLHLRNARYGYWRWGADGKVRELDELHPYLREEAPLSDATSTIGTPVEHLDLATVIKVSQAVSGEIVLEKLIDALMRTAIEQAGAERGVLILARGNELRIAAEATTSDETVAVHLLDEAVTAAVLPETVLRYVLRTRESVILDEAAAQGEFSADAYIRQRRARSILGLPLVTQAHLIGALYLENNLAARVFVPGRTAILKLLASQAAIAIENTRLYRDLARREAKIRRLVEANIIGIIVWDFEGRIVEANDAFLRIIGYDREDLASGRLRWMALTAPEWHERTLRGLDEMRATGTIQAYEKEYLRKDGSRVPVLLGAAFFDEAANQGVTFVLDLTARKRAEAEARESERRYRETEMELAHANRAATMGQLTASIAHEVSQPIAAALTNAEAALLWLDRQPPDLEEARQTLNRIVKDANRAGHVIGRIRELIKKAPPQQDLVEIGAAIREVVELTHGEAVKNGVTVRTQLAAGLPLVYGDRVQLQQVMLNLTINAIEAMSVAGESPRELRISAEHAAEGGVLLAVEDSGPGLAPATRGRLFEAFYTTKPDGLGMGLSICRSIVEAHGGRLWATANQPRGAVFCFTVPASADDEP